MKRLFKMSVDYWHLKISNLILFRAVCKTSFRVIGNLIDTEEMSEGFEDGDVF